MIAHKIVALEGVKAFRWKGENWFDRLLLWVARRRGYDMDSREWVEMIFPPAKLEEAILKHYYQVVERGSQPGELIMGVRSFAELVSHVDTMARFHYYEPVSVDGRRMFMDMEVIVLPWVDGWVIVPRK